MGCRRPTAPGAQLRIIGVLFGCFGGNIAGPALPGGSIPTKGQLCPSFFSKTGCFPRFAEVFQKD